MENFLKKRGFKLTKITDNKLLSKEASFDEKIQDNHVLLYCLKLSQKMYSWVVIWGNPSIMYHNFELIKMKGLDLANYPSENQSRYIVWKKSWK